jgi:uncharacterized protein
MELADRIAVTVVYALPERQSKVELDLPAGSSVLEAVQRSGLLIRYPDIASRPLAFAIFGRKVAANAGLKSGDRVEILRPLLHDPKETRRQLAGRGQTMGRNSKSRAR